MYHYTNLDGLFKIITNRTIKLNRLDLVDDITESSRLKDSDYSKYCYVSCWTDSKTENISLWEMYSKSMEGFCIDLPVYPFIFKIDEGNPFSFKQIISLSKKESKIFTCYPDTIYELMQEGTYTWDGLLIQNGKILDRSFLYSMDYVKKYDKNEIDPFVNYSFGKDVETIYHNKLVGTQKHKDWKFQEEKRYMIALKLFQERCHWGEQVDIKAFYKDNAGNTRNSLFLNIHESSFKSMKIIAGPKCKKESIEIIEYILDREKLNIKVENSIWKDKIIDK